MRRTHHPAGVSCHSFSSPISAFYCFVNNNLRRGRQEGEKDVTVSSLPLLNITHLLTPHPPLSPKFYFFLFKFSSNCMAPFWPWSLSSGFWTPASLKVPAKGSKLSYPSCQGFWTGMSSKQLTHKRTFVTQPVLYNMQTKFIKNQIHLQRMKVNSITTKDIRTTGRTNEVVHASCPGRQGCPSTLLPMRK